MKKPTPLPYKWDADRTSKPPFIGLTELEDLYFRRAMDALWLHEEDRLPKDPAAIARFVRFPAPEDFNKVIWSRIKKLFSEDSEGFYDPGILEQRKKKKKTSKDQSKRRKGKRNHNLEESPAVIRGNTVTDPAVNHKPVEPVQELPPENHRITEKEPTVNRIEESGQIEEPTEIRRLTESQPPLETFSPEAKSENIPAIPGKNVARETSESKLNDLTPVVKLATEPARVDNNVPEVNFDQAKAWKDLIWIWRPGKLGQDAEDLFWKEVRSRSQWHELRRRASEYRRRLPLNQDPVNFVEWFWKV